VPALAAKPVIERPRSVSVLSTQSAIDHFAHPAGQLGIVEDFAVTYARISWGGLYTARLEGSVAGLFATLGRRIGSETEPAELPTTRAAAWYTP